MTFKEAILYRNSINATLYAQNGNDAYTDSQLPYYCFLSAYSLLLLQGMVAIEVTAVLLK